MALANVEDEYKKDPNLKREDVRSLLEWVEHQPHLPKITELQAILFLHSCYYSNEQAKTTVDNYFTVRTICSDIFSNRSPNNPSVTETQDVCLVRPLPKLTPEGYTVIFSKLLNTDPDKYNFSNQIRNWDMSAIRNLNIKGTSNGLIMVADLKGIAFGHVTKLNIITMKKFMYYLQEAMPIRIKGLHFINIVPFMDKILALMKPFMKKELMSMLFLHNDMEEFYKYVPKDMLPKDYGGSCVSIKDLQEQDKKLLREYESFHKMEDAQMVNEKLRPGRPKQASDFFGVEGTFKKLEVD
ncbi:alpha-tocopherol transfer protein-like [Aethina tumida]|uniref:alpha-tocopherol transfer protein-like n=1 Tax=Aethina tumida TaxID=116153 RepID=UPI00096B0B0B|nr:alpha-tocopherol transfer protein-like [Aethina tumida]